VSTTGRDSNPGTENAPFYTIQKAIDSARKGELIYVRGGVYYVQPNTIYKNQGLVIDHKNGSETSPYRLEAYPGEQVVINGSKVPDAHAVLTLYDSSYWTFKGLIFEKSSSPRTWATHGIVLFGNSSYNIFDDIEIRDMDGVGLLITEESSYNTITHSSSHHNYDHDTQGGNADGFQVVGDSPSSTTPTGNVFTHCVAWNNGDDGFDLWHSYGNEIHTSRAWHNGYHPDGITPAGDGSGFKLGRGRAGHTVTYSVAWDNRYVGFDYNIGEGNYKIYNNTAYNNRYNFSFPNRPGIEVHNNVSYQAVVRDLLENDPSLGTHNNWNLGITKPQFVSTDPDSPDFLCLQAIGDVRQTGKGSGYSGRNLPMRLGACSSIQPPMKGSK